ncbi:MAG: hypothetical protein H7147_10895 [Frankiaceae bacterium]|nr:hypothetical protein [Arenimonas sp.]
MAHPTHRTRNGAAGAATDTGRWAAASTATHTLGGHGKGRHQQGSGDRLFDIRFDV